MARTYRKVNRSNMTHMFRRPKTLNEQKGLMGMLADLEHDVEFDSAFDYDVKISGLNRIKKRANTIPNSYDDIDISALDSKY